MLNWMKLFRETRSKRQRKTASTRLSSMSCERLEDRALLSATTRGAHVPAQMDQVEPHKATVTYPVLAGQWLFHLSTPAQDFSDVPVKITGHGAKFKATGHVDMASFTLTGKLNKAEPTSVSGKVTFSSAVDGDFKGTFEGITDQNGDAFSGTAAISDKMSSTTLTINGAKQLSGMMASESPGKKATKPTPVNPTGLFDLTTSDFGDGQVNFTSFNAKSRKVGGTITLDDPLGHGPVSVAFKGKFNPDSATRITASARFPVDSGSHVFNIKGNIDVNFSQDATSFTGTVSRTIFGHEVFNTDFDGTRVSK